MTATTVDEYIDEFPAEVATILRAVREAIVGQVPNASEKIRYGMPAIMLGGRYALHFAGWKKHVGLYPVPTLTADLEAELVPFRSGKDSVNFRYAEAVPYDLISRVTAAIVSLRGGADLSDP